MTLSVSNQLKASFSLRDFLDFARATKRAFDARDSCQQEG